MFEIGSFSRHSYIKSIVRNVAGEQFAVVSNLIEWAMNHDGDQKPSRIAQNN